MRSRAALLPHPADPFLFKYWLKFYNEVWGKEVDKLYICINSPMEQEVVNYMLSLVENNPDIVILRYGYQIEHGTAINELLDLCKEEYVMLIEDDGFIFKPGIVDRCFQYLESDQYDIVGSPRGSCSMEIYEGARTKFGLNYEGYGDHGPNFWPNFFFTKRQHLLETDRKFGARAWNRGEVIEPLGLQVQEEIAVSDTFVNTSLQLRAKGLRILEIPQYHGSPDDLEHRERSYNLFDGHAPWIHVGSLSSGVHGVLIDDFGRPLARRFVDPPKEELGVPGVCETLGERNEWERRISMYYMFLENAERGYIDAFAEEYAKAIRRVISQYGLDSNNIRRRIEAYRSIGL